MKRTDCTVGFVPPGMCERCYQHGLLKPARVVHHITPITPDNVDDASVTYDLGNLMRLCQDCHADIHSKNPMNGPRRYSFDDMGNLIPVDEQWRY